jgi:hypothetical protein
MVMEEHVGGWRWRLMGGRPRQSKEAAGSVLRRLLAAVGSLMLGAMECSEEGAEERGESRAEWRRSVVVAGR